ncbi:glycosyltransferase family 4 protein [Desertivirga brevis]|uniref:glycosyltransferase family 4 protein n=1 Tax=Desertivirga brevis TaxID=2810310 RepID=UPI001A95BE96|nr:glycosyltransferase family 1 protein [Pedobacter sp. SYSU D00873]
MRIGFDGKRAVQNFTGLGNYSRFVLNLLADHFPDNQYYLYTPKSPKSNLGIPNAVRYCHPSKLINSTLWRSGLIVSDLKRDKIDLFHGLSNELPIGIAKSGIPSIVTVHDLIFLRFPDYYPYIDRQIYKYKFEYACKNASRIVAVSKQTKEDIISFFKVPEDKIDVVYQGCNHLFQHQATEEEKLKIRKEYNLPEKFILNVGTIEERKNLLLIVKALNNAVSKNVKLVVIGRETDYAKEVREYVAAHQMHERVIFLKNVPIKDLPTIYQTADIFVYPSEFEGFGIPVIEALYSGIPVVAATGSCLEEAGGPGSRYVHPQDEIQLGWQINYILNNPIKRASMVQEGFRYVQKFTEKTLSKNLMQTYYKAINNA